MEQRSTETGLARLSDDQVNLITQTIAKGADQSELALFIQICNRTGLDPFARQIYLVPRWDKATGRNVRTPQVSIDGARLVAQRSGEYEGQVATAWCGADGVWREVWLSDDPPRAARVGVWRTKFREPCVAIALWSEYAQRDRDGRATGMWGRMPALMLAKCAEMLALRRAFPAELSGLYTAEEMGEESTPSSAPAPSATPEPPTKARKVLEVFDPKPNAPAAPAAPVAVPAAKAQTRWPERGTDVVEVEKVVPRGPGVVACLCSHPTAGKAWVAMTDAQSATVSEGCRVEIDYHSNGAFMEADAVRTAPNLGAFRDENGELFIPFGGGK
jgi:phage recombination protein Bet